MTDIDAGKLATLAEAEGWLRQARAYYQSWHHELGDDCVKRAKSALDSECFKRKPIAGFARNQQPEVVRIVADNPMGFAIINSSDFNPELHQLYTEPTPQTSKPSKSR